MKKEISFRLLALMFVLFSAHLLLAADQKPLRLYPVRDGCAFDPYKDVFAPVRNRYEPEIRGGGSATPEQRCTMQFEIGDIPAGLQINKVTFTLACAGGRAKYAGIVAYGYIAGQQINAPGDFTNQDTVLAKGPAKKDACAFDTPQDITAYVTKLYNGGVKYFGITLVVSQNAMRAYYARAAGHDLPEVDVIVAKPGAPAN